MRIDHAGPIAVAILDDYQRAALTFASWDRLPERVRVDTFADHLADDKALIARLRPYDVVIAMRERTPFTRSLIAALTNLKLLVTTGMKNASIDLAACAEQGVLVCGTGGMSSPTCELTWGLIIGLSRHIPSEDRGMRAGGWQTTVGTSLEGKTLGVVGLGRLGTRVARVGVAFDMNVMAWSPNLTDERAAQAGVERVDKATLFARADIVTIHLVLSETTRGIVGQREFAAMAPTAILVNTSRGPIVDETALVEALAGKRIAGAAIDVYDVEPLPVDHPLRSLERTVVTPHLGYVTAESYRIFYGDALDDVERWLAGNPVRVLGR